MALTPKERERIIEEETLRYETRKNLHCQNCSSRPRRWPWFLAAIIIAWVLYCRIFCGHGSCAFGGERGMMGGHKCSGMSWQPEEGAAAPGQPVQPEKPAKK